MKYIVLETMKTQNRAELRSLQFAATGALFRVMTVIVRASSALRCLLYQNLILSRPFRGRVKINDR